MRLYKVMKKKMIWNDETAKYKYQADDEKMKGFVRLQMTYQIMSRKWSVCLYVQNVWVKSILDYCDFWRAEKRRMRLSRPVRYPSSWFPNVHSSRWLIVTPSGSGYVLAKSISQMSAWVSSWTKRSELPIISWERKKSDRLIVSLIRRSLARYLSCFG